MIDFACITETLHSVEASLGHLSKLPRELRDQIYLDICGDQDVTPERQRNGPLWSTTLFYGIRTPMEQARYSAFLDLLLVSRQVSDEVAVTLYSKRQFRFNSPSDLWHIDRFGKKQQHLLTSVLLYLEFSANRSASWTDYLKPAKSLLRLQGVKTITVIISEGNKASFRKPYREAVRYSEDLSKSKALPALESATISVVSYYQEFDYVREYAEKYADWYLGKVRDLILGDL